MQHARACTKEAHLRRDNTTPEPDDLLWRDQPQRIRERDMEREMLAQVVEATHDGPWNNPPSDLLARVQRDRRRRWGL